MRMMKASKRRNSRFSQHEGDGADEEEESGLGAAENFVAALKNTPDTQNPQMAEPTAKRRQGISPSPSKALTTTGDACIEAHALK